MLTFFSKTCHKGKEKDPLVQMIRYFTVAVVATLVDYLVYVFVLETTGVHYGIAIVVGFSIGVLVNYALSVLWAFHTRNYTLKHKELFVFVWTGVVGVAINWGVVYLLNEKVGMDLRLARIPAIATAFFWNFFSKKILLFRNS